ncbi:MAG: NAD(P)-dependent oxidoreductase [Alphaproteobacteria bacterium]|nr:NAD(P)-dependent oxidoreductase [Alphaproteobacteria bacterium]
MLRHHNSAPSMPKRAVVVGGGGFVGRAIVNALRAKGCETDAVLKSEIDLLAEDAPQRLAARIQDGDALILVSFPAPARTHQAMLDALRMTAAMIDAIKGRKLAQLVAISSDAVYASALSRIDERTCRQPDSFHGMAHAARELMLAQAASAPFAVLRPCLIYGAKDPHNGYGPNRFMRLAEAGKPITLSGQGEELRDHIFIEDVAELAALSALWRSSGSLNLATGHSVSFAEVAQILSGLMPGRVRIETQPRTQPVTYRHFSVEERIKAFPDFQPTPLALGLSHVVKEGR